MNKIAMRGAAATIRWGYHSAADVGAWTLEGSSLSARLLSHDPYKLSQQPLTFVVRRSAGPPWVWVVDELSTMDGSLTATVHVQEP